MPDYQQLIASECDSIKALLLQKNADYGNAAFEPIRIFSSADPIEQIRVRIDDKLNRIRNRADKSISEDTVMDLIGYLVLLRVAELAAHIDDEPETNPVAVQLTQQDGTPGLWYYPDVAQLSIYDDSVKCHSSVDGFFAVYADDRLLLTMWSSPNPSTWGNGYEFDFSGVTSVTFTPDAAINQEPCWRDLDWWARFSEQNHFTFTTDQDRTDGDWAVTVARVGTQHFSKSFWRSVCDDPYYSAYRFVLSELAKG